MARKDSKPGPYIIGSAIAIAVIWFLLGGPQWSPFVWAGFSLFAVAITVVEVLHGDGAIDDRDYERWKLGFGALIVVMLLYATVRYESRLLLVIALFLGYEWSSDLRYYRRDRS